jgi:hypothetical protein
MGRDNGIWLLLIYLFLSVYLLPMFPHGGSANELSHWAAAASLVEKGSFDISWTQQLIGPNPDTVLVGDRIFSNKAPAIAVLAAPVYAFTRLFIGPPDASNIRVSWFVMRFFFSTLPLILLALWLYTRETDELALAALLFSTPLFVYSLLFFSHVFGAVVLYFGFRVIYDQRYVLPWHAGVAGALCGLAVMIEFTAVIPVAVFGAGLLFADKRERVRRVMFFILGGLPFALLLGWYDYALFGSPFSLSYAHTGIAESSKIADYGLFGLGWPSLSGAFLLLFSPSRGLFFCAPILLLSVARFVTSPEARTLRHRVKVAAIVITVLVLSGYNAADGGWAFGPRYLIIIVPLLLDSFFDGEIYEMSNLWTGLLFSVSLGLCVLPSLTFPLAPPEFGVPFRSFWVNFLISEGWIAPTFASVFGAPAAWWTLVPVFAAAILTAFLLYRTIRRPRRFLIGFGTGAAALLLFLFIPARSVDTQLEFSRATIAERYFRPAGRLDRLEQQAANRGDIEMLSRVRKAQETAANVRLFAPNDWPYLLPDPR